EIPEAAERLAELKALGVRLALDDFGSGYATLGLLQRFAVDLVKIDRVFVEGLTHEGGERTLVRAILRLADALGLDVVAEGVEREEQKAALLELGCDVAQGYLLGEPMPASELATRLA
ncbi:MAG: EAL domain-containing protein, partial [Thermoanaerobaculia bacterium]|nr:EAL domain-containing protein [Thermoanaerobaculia bacterium]